MNVRLYANTIEDEDLIPDAKIGLKDAFEQTINYFASKGERIGMTIEVDEAHPYRDGDFLVQNDRGVALSRFGTWLIQNDRDQTAVHMLLTSELAGGISGGALGGAWRNDPAAVVGRKGGGQDYFRSLCVHEAYHLFLNTGTLGTGANARSEHILGEVAFIDGQVTGEQTPMVNGYLSEGLAAEGECNRTAASAPYTTKLSDCTLRRTLESYRDQGNLLEY